MLEKLTKWLQGSWLLGRVLGVEIRFHHSMIFILPLAWFLFKPTSIREALFALLWTAGLLFCVFLHELGHTLTALVLKVKIKSIVLWPLGGLTSMEHSPEKPIHRFLITVAGPLVNLCLGSISGVAWLVLLFPLSGWREFFWFEALSNILVMFLAMNIALVIFNILPIYPLDGGSLLHTFLEMTVGSVNANTITFIIGLPFLIGVAWFGLYTRDYILLGVCILLFLSISTLNRNTLRWLNIGIAFFINRGAFYYLLEDYDPALQAYSRLLVKNPARIEYYLGRASAYLNLLQPDLAFADMEQALRVSPDNVFCLVLKGELHTLRKEYDAALACFRRVEELKPRSDLMFFGRGSVYFEQGDAVAGLAEINRALDLNKQVPLFYFVRSIIHYQLQNREASRADQQAAMKLSQKSALVREVYNLSVYTDQLEWANAYYGWVLEKYPRLWLAYLGRADARAVNGVLDQALADYTRAVELAPTETLILMRRGDAYVKAGQLELAAQDFRRIQTLTKKAHLRRMALEKLEKIYPSQLPTLPSA